MENTSESLTFNLNMLYTSDSIDKCTVSAVSVEVTVQACLILTEEQLLWFVVRK